MKVKELRELLNHFPQDAEVLYLPAEIGFRKLPRPDLSWFGEIYDVHKELYCELLDCEVEDLKDDPESLGYDIIGEPFKAVVFL